MSLTTRAYRFITASTTAGPLGVVRAAIGLGALLKTIELVVFLPDEETFSSALFGFRLSLPGGLWPLVTSVWACAAAALMVGFRARIAATTVGALTMFLIEFSNSYSNHLYLIGTLSVLLALGRSGGSFSLDSRRRGPLSEIPQWPVRLIQLQISVVYLYSAIGKVNMDFLSGNVLFNAANDSMFVPDLDLLSNVPLLVVVSLGAVGAELFLAIGLWIPRTRRPCFGLGLGLHLAMIVLISRGPQTVFRLGVFAMLMLSCFLLFLPAPTRPFELRVPDGSLRWLGWTRWLQRLDWLHLLRVVRVEGDGVAPGGGPTPGLQADRLQLTEPGGRTSEDFTAVRRALAVLPLTFLLAGFLRPRSLRSEGSPGRARREERTATRPVRG